MTSQKSIIIVVIVAALAIAGYWVSGMNQTDDEPAPVAETESQPAAASAPEPTIQPEPEPEPAIEPDVTETAPAPAQPVIDTTNWVCTAWHDGSGVPTTSGTPKNETCTQWSIRRAP